MTTALVTHAISGGEVVQQTNALRYLNHWNKESNYGLNVAFIDAYILQNCCMTGETTMQDGVDDLAMWCGFPM